MAPNNEFSKVLAYVHPLLQFDSSFLLTRSSIDNTSSIPTFPRLCDSSICTAFTRVSKPLDCSVRDPQSLIRRQ